MYILYREAKFQHPLPNLYNDTYKNYRLVAGMKFYHFKQLNIGK